MKKFIKKYGYLIWNSFWALLYVFLAYCLGGLVMDNFSIMKEYSYESTVGFAFAIFLFCLVGSICYISSLFLDIKSLLKESSKSSGSPDDDNKNESE